MARSYVQVNVYPGPAGRYLCVTMLRVPGRPYPSTVRQSEHRINLESDTLADATEEAARHLLVEAARLRRLPPA